jgi:dTDP-N-acetylfucosamine:lipid II N-acetylfucosaminyltransferase
MTSLIHLTINTQFLQNIQEIFENDNNFNNKYIVLEPFIFKKRVLTGDLNNVKRINFNIFNLFHKSIIKSNSIVILHGLNYWNSKFLLQRNDLKIFSCLWGGELYSNPLIRSEFSSASINKISLLKKIYEFLNYGIWEINNKNEIMQEALFKSKYISMMKEEFDLFSDLGYLNKNSTFFRFNYFPIENKIKLIDSIKTTEKTNIIIGKSAKPEENHLETIDILKGLNVSLGDIIIPVSYGDKKYKEKLIKYGTDSFGHNFKPIHNFLPLDNYLKLLSKCKIAIFGQKRQMGYGNIIYLLLLGVKIFLNKESLVYMYLKKNNVILFSIQDDLNIDFLKSPMSSKEINQNKIIIKSLLDTSKIMTNLKKLINEGD